MKPVYLIYLVAVRKDLARKKAEDLFRFKCDLSSASPSVAPIIV